MITTHQTQLVKQTWMSLRDVSPELLGDVFYTRLFFEYPALRAMFIRPMPEQYSKLVNMLNVAVARIDQTDDLIVTIQHLGVRHHQLGVTTEQYTAVGNALLWTLQKALGRAWSVDVQTAWQAFYHFLADTMIRATS